MVISIVPKCQFSYSRCRVGLYLLPHLDLYSCGLGVEISLTYLLRSWTAKLQPTQLFTVDILGYSPRILPIYDVLRNTLHVHLPFVNLLGNIWYIIIAFRIPLKACSLNLDHFESPSMNCVGLIFGHLGSVSYSFLADFLEFFVYFGC